MTDLNGNTKVELITTLNGWVKRCQDGRDGHYKRSESLFSRAQVLGYVLIYSTIFVTVFSFFSYASPNGMNTSVDIFLGITNQYIVIFIGAVAAVISGVTTQSRQGERAEIHRFLGARYANLARKMESLIIKTKIGLVNDFQTNNELDNIVTEWNNLSEDSLLTPHKKDYCKLFLNIFLAILLAGLFFIVSTSVT
jgi:hypothetical protein